MKRRHLLIVPLTAAGLILAGLFLSGTAAGKNIFANRLFFPSIGHEAVLRGVVRDANGPLTGAIVRVRATTNETTTDAQGAFKLTGLATGEPVAVTAWAPGYYIGGGEEYLPAQGSIAIRLSPLPDQDNPLYTWLSAYRQADQEGNCENCHSDDTGRLPFDEWVLDAHARTTANIHFLTMYLGTDVDGNQSPPTRYACGPDYGCFPLPPDPKKPYFGPGYKLDFPDTAGNCAACHAPAAAVDNPYGVNPTALTGVEGEGVTCDFCHKVRGVKLNPASGLPEANMPGVLSFELLRPPEDHQYFSGPFDDVAPGEDTYSALQRQSQYCAPCHAAVFWDTTIYNSFGEWLASPYNDPKSGQSCQDCHMPTLGADHFARLDRGGLIRDPEQIASHRMPGASEETLLENAVSLEVDATRLNEKVQVAVTVINDQTGHHVPTGSPLRQVILLVEAIGPDGDSLPQVSGPTLPDWAGEGEPTEGYYAGQPGKAYAKVLEERWTKVSPSGAYWNPTRVLSDNRLPALGSDSSSYVFSSLENGEVQIRVRLLYRRAFIELREQKGWQVADILMEEERLVLVE